MGSLVEAAVSRVEGAGMGRLEEAAVGSVEGAGTDQLREAATGDTEVVARRNCGGIDSFFGRGGARPAWCAVTTCFFRS